MEINQDEYISPFLISLTIILGDGEINIEGKCSQAALTVAGLIAYNIRTVKRPRIINLDNRHHVKEKKTSVNIYVGLKLYSSVRSLTFISCLFQLGICISCDRILSITKSLRNTFGHYKIFVPTNLKKVCFAVFTKGNKDKNSTVNVVQSHFHGTGISLF